MRRQIIFILAASAAVSFIGCTCLDDDVGATSMSGGSKSSSPSVASTDDKQCGGYVLIPATYESVNEQVTVQQASVTKLHVEPVYQTCRDTVLESPGHWVETPVAAVSKNVTEQVLVRPARKEWQKALCANVNLQPGEQRGDSYCLVSLPAVYETRTRSVVSTPACTNRQWVAAVYKTTERQVMVSAAYDKDVPVEARTETRSRQVLTAEARWEWRWGTACPMDERNMGTPATVPSPAPPFTVGTPTPNTNRTATPPVVLTAAARN